MQTSGPLFPAGVVRQTWLHYFNDYLRKRHIITEDEWRKMRRLIDKDKRGKTPEISRFRAPFSLAFSSKYGIILVMMIQRTLEG